MRLIRRCARGAFPSAVWTLAEYPSLYLTRGNHSDWPQGWHLYYMIPVPPDQQRIYDLLQDQSFPTRREALQAVRVAAELSEVES